MLKKSILSLFLINIYVLSQFEPNPELEWYTIETPHFYVHYHTGTERTANTTAKIAEEIYGPITKLYKYEPPDKTSWIINDESDISNGATDFYGNRIEIASVALDFDLRGTHNWLRNVITHEFTHIIQVQSSMKFSTKVPSIYLQYINYETERRPDVLYGYPNTIISYPLSGVIVPAWFAEGTAQYQRQQLGYDNWDAHRDMILRMRSLGDDLVSWEDMGQFASVTTYKAESIYNQGFALTRYIADKYGEDKLKEISGYLGGVTRLNCEGAFEKAIGKSGSDLYKEWKSFLKKDYEERTKSLRASLVEGNKIAEVGFANYYPEFSPKGDKITYLSNKVYDYGATSMFIQNADGKKDDKQLIASVSGPYSWSPDGKKIIFSRRNKPTIYQAVIFDLFEYDINKDEETQLTHGLRAHAPAYSNDGELICFVVNKDGTQNIYTAAVPKGSVLKGMNKLTNFAHGEQIYSAKWSPDGKYIIFDYSKERQRSIQRVETGTGKVEELFQDESIDFRSPVYSKDGSSIFFTCDRGGIYNVYKYDLINEQNDPAEFNRVNYINQLTNSLGGAFMPFEDSKGNLVFSSWQTDGYKINAIKGYSTLDESIRNNNASYQRPDMLVKKYADQNDSNSAASKNKFDWVSLRKFKDDNPDILQNKSYRNVATPLFIIPVLRFENYTKDSKFTDMIKPGLYFYSQDVLGKMGIFGGASINRKYERDLFLQFDYNNGFPFFKDFFTKKLSFVPSFSLAGYNVTRKTRADLVAFPDTIGVDITYDLLQFDFNMAFKIINSNHKVNAGFTFSNYNSILNTFVIPSINTQVPGSSTNYFIGRDISLAYTFNSFIPNKNDDINPIGRYFRLKYDYEINSLNPTLVLDDQGNVREVLQKTKFSRIEGDLLQGWGLFNNSHSLSVRLRGGSILGPPQDNFFDFYASGFPNMKGYPFYSIGGNEYFTANLTYRFPIVTGMDFNFLQFYFDKLYFSVYGDAGNAWYGTNTRLKDIKRDVGFELRLLTYSYYVYPTAFAFNASYGIDQFSRIFPTTTNEKKVVTYGKEWQFYFTVLFGFDFLVDNLKRMRL